ncbi:MAG: HIT family protein [Desulfarculaceae bacterium]|nr:HIT family protein [Desulfarculaceae bacterium]MCF8072590.1 HIT family protein [Desulfarculaceae bacterium]MCF8103338.1 HIT family protein [Desulfarculaceae bacterium]MCF8117489.1 HIT family protein [Desulfarculaceae bacterium]
MPDTPCRFCSPQVDGLIVNELGSVIAIADKNPVTPGHVLILPRRHTPDYFSLNAEERRDADQLIRLLKARAQQADPVITGFNIGINCGASAGQTIFHAHIHLIPRRDGDVAHPRGGVRGVIPAKMSYRD